MADYDYEMVTRRSDQEVQALRDAYAAYDKQLKILQSEESEMNKPKTMLREEFGEHLKQELREEDKNKIGDEYVEGAAVEQKLDEAYLTKKKKALLD